MPCGSGLRALTCPGATGPMKVVHRATGAPAGGGYSPSKSREQSAVVNHACSGGGGPAAAENAMSNSLPRVRATSQSADPPQHGTIPGRGIEGGGGGGGGNDMRWTSPKGQVGFPQPASEDARSRAAALRAIRRPAFQTCTCATLSLRSHGVGVPEMCLNGVHRVRSVHRAIGGRACVFSARVDGVGCCRGGFRVQVPPPAPSSINGSSR